MIWVIKNFLSFVVFLGMIFLDLVFFDFGMWYLGIILFLFMCYMIWYKIEKIGS